MENIFKKLTKLVVNNKALFSFFSALTVIIIIKRLKSKANAKAKEILFKKKSDEAICKKNKDIDKGASFILAEFKKYPEELIKEIRKADLKGLQKILRDEERMISSKDLVIIFGSLCYQEGTKNGWLADQMFQQALQLAGSRDHERIEARKSGKKLSLLHGIPFSFKDHIRYKGSSSTWGHPAKLYPLDTQTSISIQLLMLDGAIPLVKSALPIIPALSTHNLITGFAKNPYNQERTSGGSSGGEGGLVGSGCTPFGIGSDMAGSVRIPAGWCGVAGLSPSSKRVAWGASLGLFLENSKEPEGLVHATLGPLAKSVDDIAAIMKSLCKQESFEMSLGQVPMSFTSQKVKEHLEKKYRIGYYLSDGYIRPCGAMERAVLRAKGKLESQGHTLIHLESVNNTKLAKLLGETLGYDQAKTLVRSMHLEEAKPNSVQRLISFSKKRRIQIKLIQWILSKEPRVALSPQQSGEEIMDMNIRMEEEISKFYDLLQEAEVDAILCPLHAVPATNPAYFPYGIPLNYTGVFNMLGFVSGSVPFGRVTEEDEKERYEGDGIEDTITKGIRKTMKGSAGLPLAVQVASFPGRDELVVALMKQLQKKQESSDSIRQRIQPKI